jgi:hypothetical protein
MDGENKTRRVSACAFAVLWRKRHKRFGTASFLAVEWPVLVRELSQAFSPRSDSLARNVPSIGERHAMRMSRSITIVICGLFISASYLVAFRYQIVVNTSLIYRLDRWSGDIRVCVKQNPEDKYLLTCFHNGLPDTILADKGIPLPKSP